MLLYLRELEAVVASGTLERGQSLLQAALSTRRERPGFIGVNILALTFREWF